MIESKPNIGAEVVAMGKVNEALSGLEPASVARVLRWAVDAYEVSITGVGTKRHAGGDAGEGAAGGAGNGNGGQQVRQFADLAELHAATSPDTDADRALVAGYWAQYGEGNPDFGAQEINAALNNLGLKISNITTAFDSLKARKPAPVVQLKKSGSTKQARKTFRLTLAGKSAVEAMISPF
jgi:hypothetical protein